MDRAGQNPGRKKSGGPRLVTLEDNDDIEHHLVTFKKPAGGVF